MLDFKDIKQYTRQGNWEVDYSVDNLVKQIDELVKKEGLELNPDFQRGHCWTEKQQIAYVEHVLRGGSSADCSAHLKVAGSIFKPSTRVL